MRNAESGMKARVQGLPRGFTLLEVLLAMAILAVVMTVIYASFSTTGNNIEQAERLRDETDIARTLVARLSADIANAYVKSNMPRTASGANITFFRSKKEELLGELGKASEKIRHDNINMTTLTNFPRPNTGETELWEVGYFFKEKADGTGYLLFRREKRELSKDVPPLEGGEEYELTDQVESMQFRFLDSGGTWTDDGWDKGNVLPKAVEVVIVLNTGKIYTTRVDVGNS